MKRILFLLALAGIGTMSGVLWSHGDTSVIPTEDDPTLVDVASAEPLPVITSTLFLIEDGDTFAAMMQKMGYSYEDMEAVLAAGADVYDFTKITLGKSFVMQKKDGVFDAIVYDINSEEQALIQQDNTGAFMVTKQAIPYTVSQKETAGTIDSSLFVAGATAGLDDRTILALADVFAWEIDFATVIQKGDSFSLVYEERTRDGQRAPAGNILAATFTTGGKTHTAVRFEDPEGGIGYYAADGTSLQKPFLKAPLTYSRISSGYSNARFHPVIEKTTAHLAIDYAAPIGTPIMATANGTVVRAAYNGGYGNFISIRHNDTWVTQYAHLSKYAVSAGEHVEQGQVIGYVGTTGWSTGPHLHYEMVENGVKVNPLTVELPAGDPIKDEWRAAFDEQKMQFDSFFNRS